MSAALPSADPAGWYAVYARASSDPNEVKISTDRQVDRGTKHAETIWRDNVEIRPYIDNNVTAAKPEVARQDFDRLLADIRAGGCVGLVTNEQSRLTRCGPTAWDEVCDVLTAQGITDVHTVAKGVIAVGVGQRLTGRLTAVIDQDEVERTIKRTRDAHKDIAAEGRTNGGRYYGYDLIPRAVRTARNEGDGRAILVVNEGRKEGDPPDRRPPDPGLLPVRDRQGTERHRHPTPRPMIRDKETKELVPRPGAHWRTKTVRSVITKPTVAGYRGHKGELIPNEGPDGQPWWEAILEPEVWRRALRALGSTTVLDAQGKRHNAPRAHRTGRRWLLTRASPAAHCAGSRSR